MSKIFTFYVDEDGDTSVIVYDNREQFLKEFNEEEKEKSPEHRTEFMTEDEIDSDMMMWKHRVLIIEGNIIIPKAIKIVEEFTID